MRNDVPCKYQAKESYSNYINIRQKRYFRKQSLKENNVNTVEVNSPLQRELQTQI